VEDRIYINILIDTLEKKSSLLDGLLEHTLLQEQYIAQSPLDFEKFEGIIDVKSVLIEKLNQLDSGFEQLYGRVNDDLKNKKYEYKEEILQLQSLVKKITEKSTKLQALEQRNKSKVELYLTNSKKQIREYNVNSKTASNYYKSMSNQVDGQAHFFDKKK
jgi:flagellar biosynthesis/type III secretory pathway chaperone